MSIVTNAFIFEDRDGQKKLFAEVVDDNRYEKGHHIITSSIISLLNNKIMTKSGTEYIIEKFFNKDDFIDYLQNGCSKEDAEKYLFYTNLI